MNEYRYEGPVMRFDTCVSYKWKGRTMAVSEKKARSNLTFQWKKENHCAPNDAVILPGSVMLVR